MTKKERIKTTMSHREPDRVPTFELTVANPTLESVLGRKIKGFGTGEAKAASIRASMEGKDAKRRLIRENVEGMLEMYEKAGSSKFPHGISYWEVPTDVFEDTAKLYEWANISKGLAQAKAKKKTK